LDGEGGALRVAPRILLHPESISAFGVHHWAQRRMYNSTTDVDGFACDDDIYLIIEHRTGGFNGGEDDNISARMLKRICHLNELKYVQVDDHIKALAACRYPVGRVRDSRHVLWMEYTAERPRGLYLTTGNPSPLDKNDGTSKDFWTKCPQDIAALQRLALKLNISFRIIPVNDHGIPSEKDREWLRSLTYWT
jgi:hypothetical protein